MEIGTYGLNLREPGIEYHIKYPVQGLLAHFRSILNNKYLMNNVGDSRSLKFFLENCWL